MNTAKVNCGEIDYTVFCYCKFQHFCEGEHQNLLLLVVLFLSMHCKNCMGMQKMPGQCKQWNAEKIDYQHFCDCQFKLFCAKDWGKGEGRDSR